MTSQNMERDYYNKSEFNLLISVILAFLDKGFEDKSFLIFVVIKMSSDSYQD